MCNVQNIIKMIFLILTITWIYFTALIDSNHFKANQYFEKHNDRLFSRITVGLLIAYFNPMYAIALGLLFWGLFDGVLNYLRGLGVLYIGETAWTDKFFKSKYNLYIGSKIIALILALILTII